MRTVLERATAFVMQAKRLGSMGGAGSEGSLSSMARLCGCRPTPGGGAEEARVPLLTKPASGEEEDDDVEGDLPTATPAPSPPPPKSQEPQCRRNSGSFGVSAV